MTQIVGGINLGVVEGGTPGVSAQTYIFRHVGDPATNADPAVAQASPASLYLRTDTAQLYVKNLDGGWTAK